jgi:hypothetical protein
MKGAIAMDRPYLFLNGAWTIIKGGMAITADCELGRCVALFSDDDLARTYIEHVGIEGGIAAPIENAGMVVDFLKSQQQLGVTHVSLDSDPKREMSFVAPIEKVIADVKRQLADG